MKPLECDTIYCGTVELKYDTSICLTSEGENQWDCGLKTTLISKGQYISKWTMLLRTIFISKNQYISKCTIVLRTFLIPKGHSYFPSI